jgi:hypothetical protein
MAKTPLDPDNEQHIKALAVALFDHEPRNRDKRFDDAHGDTQYRYIDKASWLLSMASQAIAGGK